MLIHRPLLVAAALTLLFAESLPLAAAPPSTHVISKPAGKDGAKKKTNYKSQEESAAKSARFATVSAADRAVSGAMKAADLETVKKQTGKTGSFTGTITKVFAPKGNALVILNFAADYRTAATAVVRQKSFSTFPPLSTLKGKQVLISGTITSYQDRPEIELTSLSQVKIVK